MKDVEILLVEDNANDAELTVRALKKNKLVNNIKVINDGPEALDFLFSKSSSDGNTDTVEPKVILLDIKLPKLNGLQILKKIKESEETKCIPVVMLTSSREDPDVDEAYRLGANSYIVKPVGFNSFMKALEKVGFYWMLVNEPLKK